MNYIYSFEYSIKYIDPDSDNKYLFMNITVEEDFTLSGDGISNLLNMS
jgi:hypothetical protein